MNKSPCSSRCCLAGMQLGHCHCLFDGKGIVVYSSAAQVYIPAAVPLNAAILPSWHAWTVTGPHSDWKGQGSTCNLSLSHRLALHGSACHIATASSAQCAVQQWQASKEMLPQPSTLDTKFIYLKIKFQRSCFCGIS